MPSTIRESTSIFAHFRAGIISTAVVLGMAAFGTVPAAAKEIILSATREVTLATADQALTFCQSGKMPAGDIAYIAGQSRLTQYGPDANCMQQVPTKIAVSKAIQAVGKRVSECTLAGAKKAVLFCQNGGVGEWDIDYVSGRVGKTLSGPGYGCVVNFSTSSIANAICR